MSTVSEPFHLLKAWLYHDPVRDQYKLTDAESLAAHDELRRSVAKFYTASLWAEACLRSFGGGQESDALFGLLAEGLRLLDLAPEGGELRLSAQFLARFLAIAGHRLDLEQCGRCGLAFEPQAIVYVSREEGSLVCVSCRGEGSFLALPPGARRYLSVTADMPLAQAASVGLEQASLSALRAALYLLVQSSLEAPLKSLDCAAGYL